MLKKLAKTSALQLKKNEITEEEIYNMISIIEGVSGLKTELKDNNINIAHLSSLRSDKISNSLNLNEVLLNAKNDLYVKKETEPNYDDFIRHKKTT